MGKLERGLIFTKQYFYTKTNIPTTVNYYSQSKQDFIIDYFFEGKKGGTFVDISAHNGITMSNSYFFEKERN